MAIVRTVAAQAAHEIRQRILSGVYEAGFPLRQETLATELGISRIPLREAFLQLEAEGLVRIAPHKGAVVAEFSLAEIEELFELRALLEPRLLALSAPRFTAEDFAKLDAIQADYAAQMRAQNVVNWGALNTELHMLLYRHAGRSRTLAIVAGLLSSSDRYTRVYLSASGQLKRAEREHGEIIELCRTRKFSGATSLLKKHIVDVGNTLVEIVAKQQKKR
jgi:DNA-binding GntR family transcriptional regulator